MHILINRALMSVIAKHKDKTLLDVEAPEGTPTLMIDEEDPNSFNALTEYELRVLYRTLGTVSGIGTLNRATLVSAVQKLLRYLPMTTLPRQRDTLFSESAAVQGPTASDQQPAKGTAAAAKGGVRGTIWSVADMMWEAAGKPVSKADVLALRKQIMNTLESENGINRNSASNELGNWQKNRIQLA